MKIKRFTIEGFKSIKELIEIELGDVNAIIGPNNCGKSNILLALYKVLGKNWITKNSFDKTDVYREDEDQNITIEIEFDTPTQYHAFKGFPVDVPIIKFHYTKYKIGPQKGLRRLDKSRLQSNGKPVFTFASKPKAGEKPKMVPLTTIPQVVQEGIPVIYIGSSRDLKYQLPKSQNSLLGSLMQDINNDFENPDNKILVNEGTEQEAEVSRVERFKLCIDEAIRALKTEEFEKLETAIKTNALEQLGFDPKTETDKLDLFFNPLTSLGFYKSLEIFVNEFDYSINATELGSGFQNAIVLAILKAFEERRKQGALFLIEEPEMYLHPQMQRSLYKTIREIGKTNQVLYITHSPNFVTIPNFDEIILTSKDKDGTKITQSKLPRDPKLKRKYSKELNAERSELFFARKVLVVEGDTEKMSIPVFAERMKIDLDKKGCSIIEVGGKRNLIDYIEICLSFNIPVGVVYDTDSSDFNNKKEEEEKYNENLESYSKKGVKVYKFEKNYEDELKKEYGDEEYTKYCERYGRNKTHRAKLMASDEEIGIPKIVEPIINWMGE